MKDERHNWQIKKAVEALIAQCSEKEKLLVREYNMTDWDDRPPLPTMKVPKVDTRGHQCGDRIETDWAAAEPLLQAHLAKLNVVEKLCKPAAVVAPTVPVPTANTSSDSRQSSSRATGSSAGDFHSSTGAGSSFTRNGVPVAVDHSKYERESAGHAAVAEVLKAAIVKLGGTPTGRAAKHEDSMIECSAAFNHVNKLKEQAKQMNIDVDRLLAPTTDNTKESMTTTDTAAAPQASLTERCLNKNAERRKNAEKLAPPPKRDSKLNWTEQVLAANGVKTLEELDEKKKYPVLSNCR